MYTRTNLHMHMCMYMNQVMHNVYVYEYVFVNMITMYLLNMCNVFAIFAVSI